MCFPEEVNKWSSEKVIMKRIIFFPFYFIKKRKRKKNIQAYLPQQPSQLGVRSYKNMTNNPPASVALVTRPALSSPHSLLSPDRAAIWVIKKVINEIRGTPDSHISFAVKRQNSSLTHGIEDLPGETFPESWNYLTYPSGIEPTERVWRSLEEAKLKRWLGKHFVDHSQASDYAPRCFSREPVRRKAKQYRPLRKAFSVVFCSSFNVENAARFWQKLLL